MTAKHRKGKGNHKHEDNFFKNEVAESEVRAGANNYPLLLVLFLMIVIGGASGAWFCFQQHQTLTYLTDSLTGMQMKIVKLQSSHEEMRQSSGKHVSESLETRLNALEESYALAQKQVGMALATAEQLRTSDLPAQVLSLHTEMKARLAEMQQATVSLEQLSQLQTMLKGKSEEFEGVRIQVEGLAALSTELSHKVEVLAENLGEAESKLDERVGQVTMLSTTLDGQAAEVLRLKEQLHTYQAQLEASTLEMAAVRELLEHEQSQRVQQASVEEQYNTLVGETQPPAKPEEQTEEQTAPAVEEEAAAATEGEQEEEEEEALPADVEKEASNVEEEAEADEADEGEEASEGDAAAQDEAPVEQEDSETHETAPAEEVEAVKEDQTAQDESDALSEQEEVDSAETAEEGQGVEEEMPEEETVQEEPTLEEEKVNAEEEVSEGDEEQQDVAAEEESHSEEAADDEGEEPLENDALPEEE
ncbi:uncharacterized protein LOC143326552 isoform X2 [Chaetodon auriga]|uniref:uncharacterized protein LOC143326552 isoform X2 n=1 Tax=Chaetodon auriga TaxID=39042 RepID=UPI004032B4D9